MYTLDWGWALLITLIVVLGLTFFWSGGTDEDD